VISHLFLQISLVGADWVLVLLILVSLISITLILERAAFYRAAARNLLPFRSKLLMLVKEGKWNEAFEVAANRAKECDGVPLDLETGLARVLLQKRDAVPGVDVLTEIAQSEVVRAKIQWDKNLSILATIGSNAPFIGLFGTVLGIIKAFHDLSQQAMAAGAQTVSAGISEALIATAVGILVAIPAVVAFNLFQRQVKKAMSEAEALKSFLIGALSESAGNGARKG
jgi:biopolymer transport protein ExbB